MWRKSPLPRFRFENHLSALMPKHLAWASMADLFFSDHLKLILYARHMAPGGVLT